MSKTLARSPLGRMRDSSARGGGVSLGAAASAAGGVFGASTRTPIVSAFQPSPSVTSAPRDLPALETPSLTVDAPSSLAALARLSRKSTLYRPTGLPETFPISA